MSLLVTGSIGIDSVDTPTGSVTDVLGGSAVYFAAAASFFVPVRLVAAVGADVPAGLGNVLEHFKIDTRGFEIRAGSNTFRWHGKYRRNMNERETLAVQPNVLAEALPPVPDAYRDSEYVFLANTDPGSQLEFRRQFPHCKLCVADTMDLWISTQCAALTDLLRNIDGLVLNNEEAEQLTGEPNIIRAAELIVQMGPKFVIVKKGEHGALVEHDGVKVVLPAFPASQVVDPTGAGDSFAGGVMGHLAATGDLSHENLRIAMAWGTVVASFTIESFSLDRLMRLTRAELNERFEHYRSMLAI